MLNRKDEGQLTLLIVGYVSIALALIVVAVDVSKVFLARRALSSTADAAALSAAQSLDRDALYAGRAACTGALPLDPTSAERAADESVADDVATLRLTAVDPPSTTVNGATVTVEIHARVSVPFGRVLSLLGSSYDGGAVPISVTARAQSALSAPGPC